MIKRSLRYRFPWKEHEESVGSRLRVAEDAWGRVVEEAHDRVAASCGA